MKTMDESMESEDCAIISTAPPKMKKLKQARLPFQNLSSPTTPNTQSAKKRKHMSPSPTTFRSSKIVKITTKENTNRKTVTDEKGDNAKAADDGEDVEPKPIPVSSDTSPEKLANDGAVEEPVVKNKIVEGKSHDKPGAITRFFKKPNIVETKKDMPFVMLTRCDNNDEASNSLDRKKNVDEKLSLSKEDESSNEDVLAEALEDSETEDDGASKDKLDASSDNAGANSDSDSDRGISSSDDETEEQKTSTDAENAEGSMNGKGLDRTPTSGVKAEGSAAARRKLTPKQLAKKMDSTKRREEREKLKLEKEKKREEERLNRQKEKEAKQREKKEKEEAEKELRRKEKEQKELRKQKDIEQKQKEKEAKEEDRRKREEAKEEEKRKKEEERLEAKRKEQKAASTFVSFFVPKKAETKAGAEEKIVLTSHFIPFEVKVDMRVAPICRRSLNDSEKTKFDEICIDKAKETDDLYVAEIKKNRRKIRKSGKTWPPESKDDDVVIIEDDNVGSCNMVDQNNTVFEKQRAKFLRFAENRRPPYWGTWRKRSSAITPRKPFSKDTKWFDYDVDSDDEWEEEEPGESLRGSDDEKDEENPDDDEYDVDNEFMVPHGYLSDEEAQADEDEEDMSPETQKLKLKILGAEFEEERKTQTSKIKPRVIGPIWQSRDDSYPENLPQKLMEFLTARQAWTRETPIVLAPVEANSTNASENSGTAKSNSGTGRERRGAKKTKVPTEALPELIRLIHVNPHGLNFLIKEFMTFWNRKQGCERPLSKSSLNQKIREFAKRMACPEEGPMHLKACWYVSEETRNEYLGEEQLTVPNNWSYALTPRRKTLTEAPEVAEKPEKDEKEKKSVPLITQYTKKITHEEMKKQLEVKPAQLSSPKASTSQSKPPKRATLISVTRGEQFPKSSIINAFSRAATSIRAATPKDDSPIVDKADQPPKDPVVIDLESENSV